MSDLTANEKKKVEKLFGMGSGYVLEFSNRSFQEFIQESAGIDIYDAKYNYESGSKANRLRALFRKEPNHLVGKVIGDLLQTWQTDRLFGEEAISAQEQKLYDECLKVEERLKADVPVEDIDALTSISIDRDFNLLLKSIRENIQKNEPETALDRLHTFVVKYVRQLCEKHGIDYDRNKPLHSLFGEYVKYLKKKNLLQSQMTERILKSAISTLEAFNNVRNNQSFAHDNPLLNYNESTLISNNVCSLIRFIGSVEDKIVAPTDEVASKTEELDDLPF